MKRAPTRDRTTVARGSAKVLSFTCAPWKKVRTFEEIVGIFQDAHVRKPVRIFEGGAHLRSRAVALGYPLAGAVPLARKVAQQLASVWGALCGVAFKTGAVMCSPGA